MWVTALINSIKDFQLNFDMFIAMCTSHLEIKIILSHFCCITVAMWPLPKGMLAWCLINCFGKRSHNTAMLQCSNVNKPIALYSCINRLMWHITHTHTHTHTHVNWCMAGQPSDLWFLVYSQTISWSSPSYGRYIIHIPLHVCAHCVLVLIYFSETWIAIWITLLIHRLYDNNNNACV